MLKKSVLLLIAALIAFAPEPAQATITFVQTSPASKTVRSDRDTRITLIWTVRTDGGLTKTVETDDGAFLINSVAASNTPPLPSQTKTVASPAGGFTFTFTETITVPLALIRQAHENNEQLFYERIFSDDNFVTQQNRQILLRVSGGIGGDLTVSRMRLSFDDNAAICSAAAGDDVTVRAFIETEGSGALRGSWQVRSNAAGSHFRTIKAVQAPISAGRDVELTSPPIQLDSSGRYDVRFKIDSPVPGFPEPFVTCAVAGSDKILTRPILAGTPVEVVSPAAFMPLDAKTRIEWKPQAGAKAYLIEILAEQDGTAVAAQEVKAGETVNRLSPITLEKLDPARRYLVRVLAK